MTTQEKITAKSGMALSIETDLSDDRIHVSIKTDRQEDCVFHWGLCRFDNGTWEKPPESAWPTGTRAFDEKAVRTPFSNSKGILGIAITLKPSSGFSSIPFVLYYPDKDAWDNNNGKNYRIKLPKPETKYSEVIQRIEDHIKDNRALFKHVYALQNDYHLGVAVTESKGQYHIVFVTDISEPTVLHWGAANHSRHEWALPPARLRPSGTTLSKGKAAETPFQDRQGLKTLELVAPHDEAPLGIPFVLKILDGHVWLNDHGRNFFVPIVVPPEYETAFKDPQLAGLADEIVAQETGNHSWTLMHRFNLCYDLLDRIGLSPEVPALLFVWLRFSAIRQLDWQRRYNTQPRELSHALDRLTHKLAAIYAGKPAGHEFVRLMLTTMGRGGEGQRVRDEVLNIMHRHHIKEVSGHFMEEWHQKLHNNTTPDDVVICEAYIDFQKSDGDLGVFYDILEAGGITTNRLQSYERPIISHPDFIPHLKGALIHDFEAFLRILRSVHAGTDLETAIQSSIHNFPQDLQDVLRFIWDHRGDTALAVVTMVGKITEARRQVEAQMERQGENVRDLLFIDLALEDFLRVVIERNLHTDLADRDLVALTDMVLENFLLTTQEEEATSCLRHWQRLERAPAFDRLWSLEAKAVLDRLGRVLAEGIDRYYGVLQPKAEVLGKAFEAEPWAVSLFSEEVVRGRLVFLLSTLLRKIDPLLRKQAHLGNWQVVSPGHGTGELVPADTLQSVQGQCFSHRTVLLADRLSGEEEIPKNVTAILTADTTDIVSHIAIRARNSGVLLASCYDAEMLEELQDLTGHWVSVRTSPDGNVVFEKTGKGEDIPTASAPVVHPPLQRPTFTAYAVSEKDFTEKIVGGKSNNLKGLHGTLPSWISLPKSAALPFGVFEKVIAQDDNKTAYDRYQKLLGEVETAHEGLPTDLLGQLQQTILTLKAPADLIDSLQKALAQAGLPWPGDWENAWTCIKKVWASKWNGRAYLSRQSMGIAHADLFMAVLIQKVVDADYSFVIHTANPFSEDRDEVFAEVVPGLGETLVGNFPGRALSFTCKKGHDKPELGSFPSKSVGLFGSGLIFRSDSNGEDLADYAGAGLYDSVMTNSVQEVLLDYTTMPLVTDPDFQNDLMRHIAAIGAAVEETLEVPQDIEGAYCKGTYHVVQTRPQVGLARESPPG